MSVCKEYVLPEVTQASMLGNSNIAVCFGQMSIREGIEKFYLGKLENEVRSAFQSLPSCKDTGIGGISIELWQATKK